MPRYRLLILSLGLGLLLGGGCSSSSKSSKPARRGAKVNLAHFFLRPASYQGKMLTLFLKADDAIDGNQGQSLRQYANRYVRFLADGPKGERFHLVIRIPEDIPLPDGAKGDTVIVTFLCSRGNLQQGNEAKAIEKPSGGDEIRR
jgi:hypothetical protein